MIVCGYSLYSRFIDFSRFRQAADRHQSYLLCDMAHFSGLVAADIPPSNPFDYCDIVTTTVHKTLRGPRSGLVFFRKSTAFDDELGLKVLDSVFPGNLGGPQHHSITAMATALLEASTSEFREYQQQVVKNSIALAETLKKKGYRLMTDGTENHMIMLSLENKGAYGDEVYNLLDVAEVTSNPYTVKGTPHTARPNGLRVGTPPMTTRGCAESDFETIGELLDEFVHLSKDIRHDSDTLAQFKQRLLAPENQSAIGEMRSKVNRFCEKFDYNHTREMI